MFGFAGFNFFLVEFAAWVLFYRTVCFYRGKLNSDFYNPQKLDLFTISFLG
jgi:hypothetical protein